MTRYQQYKDDVTCDIADCLKDMGCQPIIFAGAGISRRYFGAPSWEQLLEIACKSNPLIEKDFIYYKQAHGDLPNVATSLVPAYHEWAWGNGKEEFPSDLFTSTASKEVYLKHYLACHIASIQPRTLSSIKPKTLKEEIKLLQDIRPNSIITTNYDQLLELVFPEYTPIIGQTIIKSPNTMIGEIFKIHGCVTSLNELVLTASDYSGWNDRKKYLSAKLLTYFLEHPVLIVGYSAQDSNVLAILRDIDEILASSGDIVSNIYYVIYDDTISEDSNPGKEILLDLGNGSSMRVKAIYTNDLSWVYRSFAASEGIENVNPKILRALISRTYDLVRHDIPKATLEVNYETLEQAVNDENILPKLLGITSVSDPEQFNAAYPYTLTAVSKKLGFMGWHSAHTLASELADKTGVNIKESDNQYHIAVKSGESSMIHKYSDAFVSLLQKVRDGENYEIKLKKRKATNKATQWTR